MIINLYFIQFLIYSIIFLPALISIYLGFHSLGYSVGLQNIVLKNQLKRLSIAGMFLVCFFSYFLLYFSLRGGNQFNF